MSIGTRVPDEACRTTCQNFYHNNAVKINLNAGNVDVIVPSKLNISNSFTKVDHLLLEHALAYQDNVQDVINKLCFFQKIHTHQSAKLNFSAS